MCGIVYVLIGFIYICIVNVFNYETTVKEHFLYKLKYVPVYNILNKNVLLMLACFPYVF